MRIKFGQRLCRHPQFLMYVIANGMHFKLRTVGIVNLKTRHVPKTVSGFCIPFFRDLTGVLFVQHRIKDRLLRQSRRELLIAAFMDQFKFGCANRSVQYHSLYFLIWIYKWSRLIISS